MTTREVFTPPTLSTDGFEVWHEPGSSRDWEPYGFTEANGDTYVLFRCFDSHYREGEDMYLRKVARLTDVLEKWSKNGHRYPEHFACQHDGCTAEVTDFEGNATQDGWVTYGWGNTRCPAHAGDVR